MTSSIYNVQLIYGPLSQVELHPEIYREVGQAYAALNHKIEASAVFSPSAVHDLLHCHFIQVVRNRKKAFWCISGLRSWQLAKLCLTPEQEIPLILRQRIRKENIVRYAWTECYLSHLAFVLPDNIGKSGLAAFWQQLPQDLKQRLTPGLKDKAKVSRVLGGDRRLMSSPLKFPSSRLKAMADE